MLEDLKFGDYIQVAGNTQLFVICQPTPGVLQVINLKDSTECGYLNTNVVAYIWDDEWEDWETV